MDLKCWSQWEVHDWQVNGINCSCSLSRTKKLSSSAEHAITQLHPFCTLAATGRHSASEIPPLRALPLMVSAVRSRLLNPNLAENARMYCFGIRIPHVHGYFDCPRCSILFRNSGPLAWRHSAFVLSPLLTSTGVTNALHARIHATIFQTSEGLLVEGATLHRYLSTVSCMSPKFTHGVDTISSMTNRLYQIM